MQQLKREGITLFYEEAGKGAPPIVLVHGLAGDHTFMTPQFEHFRRTHRVVSVDLRGHGQSEQPQQEYTIAGFADDLAWLCRELGTYKPVLIGHSLGGMIVLDLAARYPEVPAAMVALDATIVPPAGTDAWLQPVTQGLRTPAYQEVLRQFMELNFAPTDDPQRKARIVDQMASAPQHVVASAWEGMLAWDSATAAAACKVPVLYIDTGTPNADLLRFHELCPQLVIGKTVGSGHFLELEVPEQVNAMIDRFLSITLSPSTTTVQAGATEQTAQ
jgi:pimeloyl-ACP methyl ester carboxylesterase